jgi:citrate synthase
MTRSLQEIIASALGVPPGRITPDLEFDSIPEWDSLNHVNLMLALENHVGTEIDADLMITLTNVRAIYEFAARHNGARPT